MFHEAREKVFALQNDGREWVRPYGNEKSLTLLRDLRGILTQTLTSSNPNSNSKSGSELVSELDPTLPQTNFRAFQSLLMLTLASPSWIVITQILTRNPNPDV